MWSGGLHSTLFTLNPGVLKPKAFQVPVENHCPSSLSKVFLIPEVKGAKKPQEKTLSTVPMCVVANGSTILPEIFKNP